MSKSIRLRSARLQADLGLLDPPAETLPLFDFDPSFRSGRNAAGGCAAADTVPNPWSPDREELMLDQLDRRDRLRLVEFVCSFAWADLEIRPEERDFIARLIKRLDLDDEENRRAQQWLERPPQLEGLDPTSIPAAHRRIFVDAIDGLISSDGEVSDEERESFEVFQQLLVD